MAPSEIAVVACTLAAGAALQSAAGFGLGLFSVPVFVWLGLSVPNAIALMLGAVTLQTAQGCRSVREHIAWKETLRVLVVRTCAMPLGLLALAAVSRQGLAMTKTTVGAALLLAVLASATIHPPPQPSVARRWETVAGCASGFFATFVGMGGPPLILFALAHDWPPRRIQAFLWSQFLGGAPVIVAFLAMRFGLAPVRYYLLGLLAAPAVWVGTVLGLRLAKNWSRQALNRVAYLLLSIMALSALISPWL